MTRSADRHPVRRLGSTAFLLLIVALSIAFGVRTCGAREPAGTPHGASARRAAADAAQDRSRRHVTQAGSTAPEQPSTRTAEIAAADEDGAPRSVEERSPPWQRLEMPRLAVTGRVVDATGTPQAGVVVHLVSTWLPEDVRGALRDVDAFSRHLVVTTESAADGTFRLDCVDGGARRFVVGALGRPLLVAPVHPGGANEIVVPPGHRTLVVAVHDPGGHAVASAIVWAGAELPWEQSPLKSTLAFAPSGNTDENGTAELRGVPAGRVLVHVLAPGGTRVPQRFEVDVPADGVLTTGIVLRRETTVRIQVKDATSGAPVRGASAHDPAGAARSGESGANGSLTLEMPLEPNVAQSVVVAADGYAPRTAPALIREAPRDGLECAVEVPLHRTAAVQLRCLDERGEPVRHATVVVRSSYVALEVPVRTVYAVVRAGTTDEDGRVRVEGLHPGGALSARLEILRDGVLRVRQEIPPLGAGEMRELGAFVLTAGRALRGVVVDADGAAVPGALVVAVPRDPAAGADARLGELARVALTGDGRRAETSEHGAFAIPALPPGLYDVLVVRPRPGLLREAVAVASGTDPVPLELHLPATRTVRGRVLRPDGAPAVGVTVLHEIAGPVPLNAVDTVDTDAQGCFEISRIPVDGAPLRLLLFDDEEGPDAPPQIRHVDRRGGETVLRLR